MAHSTCLRICAETRSMKLTVATMISMTAAVSAYWKPRIISHNTVPMPPHRPCPPRTPNERWPQIDTAYRRSTVASPAGSRRRPPRAWLTRPCSVQLVACRLLPASRSCQRPRGGVGLDLFALAKQIKLADWNQLTIDRRIEPGKLGDLENDPFFHAGWLRVVAKLKRPLPNACRAQCPSNCRRKPCASTTTAS